MRLLLSRGADVNLQSPEKIWRGWRTALQAARGKGHEAIVRLLLENGAREIEPEDSSEGEKSQEE